MSLIKISILLIFNFSIKIIEHDKICREHENYKYKNYDFKEFKEAFNDDQVENQINWTKDSIFSPELNNFRFKRFNIKTGRKPIIKYDKHYFQKISKKFSKFKGKKKVNKSKELILKVIEYFENLLLIYTDPIKERNLIVNDKYLYPSILENVYKKGDIINIKDFDYYIFFDLFDDENTNTLAYNTSNFSNVIFNSRPVYSYIHINLHHLSDGPIKYSELMVIVHEMLHSFGLVSEQIIDNMMKKYLKGDIDPKIKNYVAKHNDFLNLYWFLYNKRKEKKLYNTGRDHFNVEYLYNDIMRPSQAFVNHITYISANLFELLTNYEIRINKKLIRRNYETCWPILMEWFSNEGDCVGINRNYSFIQSFKNKNNYIKLNNKCTSHKKSFCSSNFQYKNYCNIYRNKFTKCYNAETYTHSNCFDTVNNNIPNNNEINEFYGINSNCIELSKNHETLPFCLKNEVDYFNLEIKILIRNNYYICKYERRNNQIIQKNSNNDIKVKISYISFYNLKCPDMNKFYYNNVSNLCKKDCFLNGKCIGFNKCECFDGYDERTNCKHKKSEESNIIMGNEDKRFNLIPVSKSEIDSWIISPDVKNNLKQTSILIFRNKLSNEKEEVLKNRGIVYYYDLENYKLITLS